MCYMIAFPNLIWKCKIQKNLPIIFINDNQ